MKLSDLFDLYSQSPVLLACMSRSKRILWQIPDCFTPSFTPSFGYARNEGVASPDRPANAGLFEFRRTKSKVLLHSGLPSQSPRQSRLTTLTAFCPYKTSLFSKTLTPDNTPKRVCAQPLSRSLLLGLRGFAYGAPKFLPQPLLLARPRVVAQHLSE